MKSLHILISFVLFTHICAQNSENLSDEAVLKLYENLRVADVSDGMDVIGLRDVGLVDQKIVALWKDFNDFDHIFRGIAITARYVPTNKVVPSPMTPEDFKKWEGSWYNNISPEYFADSIKKGSVIVIDCSGDGDVGSVGSFNSLAWVEKGAVGIVSNGGIRDTDEIIKQRIPVYLDMDNRGRGIRPGRNELESVNKPITVGGVLINPGDVIVADGDGVIVVPRQYAQQVAEIASEVLSKDKAARRNLYKKMGIEPDKTISE